MKFFLKSIIIFNLLLLLVACSTSEKEMKKEKVIPNKITMLFVTQPNCPSCDKLEETMRLERPKALIEKYFQIKKVHFGEPIPANLPPANGTPTVYFVGSDNEALVEPIIGEKSESELMEFLEDSFYEFNRTYGVDIRELYRQRENNETNQSTTDH